MSNQFISRLVNYIANELLIKGLASSRTFQKLALRTDANIREVSKMSNEAMDQFVQNATQAAGSSSSASSTRTILTPPKPPLRGFPGFMAAFAKEIQKDLGIIKK